ncbi:MAG TPA: DNA-3-methyladenine glycosylase I [Actinomycetota bacterium]|nr:DNA-3-methyladenine glycosylase I [Actinomycetota bacterium]
MQGGRCFGDGDRLYERYHDDEWGRPVTDDRGILERLCLEAFQSGLSWLIVLRKRQTIRRAFAGFDPRRVAAFTDRDVDRLLEDPGIIRNRAKVEAAVANARATLALERDGASLAELVWSAVDEPRPVPSSLDEIPPATEASTRLARDLRRRGFRFLGPTTVYATLQAAGVVNDHLRGCPVRDAVAAEQTAARRRLIGA